MTQKNTPYLYPFLPHCLYQINSIFIYEYFLHLNFKLIFCFSTIYNSQKQQDLQSLNIFFLKSVSIHWTRVVFRGKGFRLRKFKNYNKLTLNFGHSHWAKVTLSINYFFKKLKRQNYLALFNHYTELHTFRSIIKQIKPLNVYTKRGLRLKKQYIKRRFGKISQVVSSLH